MKTHSLHSKIAPLLAVALALLGLLKTPASAQQMPQDHWRYDGLQFASPVPGTYLSSITSGSGGIYVGEADVSGYTTHVLQFTEGGVFVRRFGTAIGNIYGLTCDPAGNVYVFDGVTNQVNVFDPNGAFLRQWGSAGTGDGQFTPSTVGNAMIAVDRNSQVYVCDPGNYRVQVFSTTGSFLRKWGQQGSLPSQFGNGYPYQIAVTADGKVFVNGANPGVIAYDSNGTYLSSVNASLGGTFWVSPDGLLLAGGAYNYYFSLFDAQYSIIVDFNGIPGVRGTCFSKRGDIYSIANSGVQVTVYEREYSGVQNSLIPPALPQPMVLASGQRTGTNWLDIDYQVTDADSSTVTTGALVFKNGNNTLDDMVQMSTFMEGTGANLGANQPTGVSRHLTWNMAADWSVDFSQIQVEVLAKDSRNLLGVHYITVPAAGASPAFPISSAPVTDAQLNDLWYWFVGTRQAGTSFAPGRVTGTSGIYTGQLLATTASTTTAGRTFAYGQMGVRAPTMNEIARANAGNYGFSSVDSNSVVMQAQTATNFLKIWAAGFYDPNAINVATVAAGSSHTLFVTTDGTLWAVGDNGNGQLGDGTTTGRSIPVEIATGVSQVAAGAAHSLFLKTDGTLWATGYNGYGQLGNGTTTARTTPVQIATGVAQIAAGSYHSLFVKTDGTLWAMGYNGFGQLGDNTTTDRSSPVQVATGVARAYSGSTSYHSLFIKTNGTLWAMGRNGNGQLGDGTNSDQATPEQIASGVALAATGQYHSLYVITGGALFTMGYNNYGQLGDGTTTTTNTPVQVASGVSKAAAGAFHTFFTKTDKTLWAMGYNAQGQLNDGTTTNRSVPIQVDVGVSSVAAGDYYGAAIITGP